MKVDEMSILINQILRTEYAKTGELGILFSRKILDQHDLYHVYIDFEKAFDRVWHAALWATMKKYNIGTNLIRVIKHLYDKAISAVLLNGSIEDWFRTTVPGTEKCRENL